MISGLAQVMAIKPILRSFFSGVALSCAIASSAPNGKKEDTAARAAEEPTAWRKRRRVSSLGKSARITADSITRRLSVSASSERGSSTIASSCSAWLACLPQSQPAPRRTPGLNGLENADTETSSIPVVGIRKTSASSVPRTKGNCQATRQVLIRQGVHRNIRRSAKRRTRGGGHPGGAPRHCLGACPGFGASCAPNPPELGILEHEIKRVKGGRHVLIPASGETRGHATTGNAALWRQHLADLLQRAPRLAQ